MNDLTKDFNTVIATAFEPPLKHAGFRKTGLLFNRDHGTSHQVVSLQMSHGNSREELKFYINVGIGLPVVWAFEGRQPKAPVKAHNCHLSTRLESIVPDAPPHHVLTSSTVATTFAEAIAPLMQQLVDRLDPLDTPEALLASPYLLNDRMRAKIFYCLGRDDEAIEALKDFEVKFADRKNPTVADSIRILKLTRLG